MRITDTERKLVISISYEDPLSCPAPTMCRHCLQLARQVQERREGVMIPSHSLFQTNFNTYGDMPICNQQREKSNLTPHEGKYISNIQPCEPLNNFHRYLYQHRNLVSCCMLSHTDDIACFSLGSMAMRLCWN